MLLPEHTGLILNEDGVERMIRALLIARRDAQRYEKYHERTREDVQFYTEILGTLGYVETEHPWSFTVETEIPGPTPSNVYEQFVIGPVDDETNEHYQDIAKNGPF